MTEKVVAGVVRKVELTPAEEMRCVISWLRHDVHLGPHTPGRKAIYRAADLLERLTQEQFTDDQTKLLHKIDAGVQSILQELQIAIA